MLPRALLLLLLLLAGTVPVSKFIAHIYACCLPCCAVLLTQRCSSVVHHMCGASHVWCITCVVHHHDGAGIRMQNEPHCTTVAVCRSSRPVRMTGPQREAHEWPCAVLVASSCDVASVRLLQSSTAHCCCCCCCCSHTAEVLLLCCVLPCCRAVVPARM